VILNSWKEIAAYLKCGVRTAQRWQEDLHMPVMRIRAGKRGPVVAESQRLDEWMKHRQTKLSSAEQINTATTLTTESMKQGCSFLFTEIATGRSFVRIAHEATNEKAAARRRRAARAAYDSIERHLKFTKAMPKAELNRFNAELEEFKSELAKLGEIF